MNPRGFTITELLVSVAVIALLMGLMVPALAAARASARSTRCTANLRQMAIAAQQYSVFHDDWPAALLYARDDGEYRIEAWDWVTTPAGGLVGPGAMWSFTDEPGSVLQCPDYHGPASPGDPFTGYNYNTSYLAAEEQWHPAYEGCVRPGIRPHACARSAACAMFGEGGRAGGNTNKFMRAPLGSRPDAECPIPLDPATVYSGGQAFRHRGATNVAWVDGHVAPVDRPHRGAGATEELLDEALGFPDNGFLSDDDSAYDPR